MLLAACGGDESAAEPGLVGAGCQTQDDCQKDEQSGDVTKQCLLQFRGGYCAIDGCERDLECPSGSACVAHGDGNSYCFRLCSDDGECNRNREPGSEASCTSSAQFLERSGGRVCVPSSD
jgi:hypothetical protein